MAKRIFTPEQKARRRIVARAWDEKNREKLRERQKKYREDNAEATREKSRRWHRKNIEAVRARKSTPEYRALAKIRSAAYRKSNAEKLRLARVEYCERPEVIVRRAAEKNRTIEFIEPPTRPRPLFCEICDGTSHTNTRLHFDHCHDSGRFRGWLCQKCNMALGLVNDSADTLKRMISYLENCSDRKDDNIILVDVRKKIRQ